MVQLIFGKTITKLWAVFWRGTTSKEPEAEASTTVVKIPSKGPHTLLPVIPSADPSSLCVVLQLQVLPFFSAPFPFFLFCLCFQQIQCDVPRVFFFLFSIYPVPCMLDFLNIWVPVFHQILKILDHCLQILLLHYSLFPLLTGTPVNVCVTSFLPDSYVLTFFYKFSIISSLTFCLGIFH